MEKKKVKDPVIFKTQYNVDTATKLNDEIKEHYSKNKIKQELLIEYPTVYVINDEKGRSNKKYDVYVGETNDIQRRTLQHIDEDPKTREDFLSFNQSDNVEMYVIGHEHFNKSLTLDIENRLMQYLSGSPAVHHLNNRRHNEQNKYYDSKELRTIFNKIWVNLNKKNKDLFPAQEIIESSALFKASPFNKLTNEQIAAKNQIIATINKALVKAKEDSESESQLILVKGMAGSGKTVLMSNIFYDLINENQLSQEDNNSKELKVSFLVNQNEQLTVYQQIAEKLEIGNTDNVLKPSTFIKNTDPQDKVGIAIIDEAHLLLTQNNQAFKKEYGKNMLKAILQRAKIVVAVFDPMQVLTTTAVWDAEDLQKMDIRAGKENIITLHNQMRIQASQATINWLNKLIDEGMVESVPQDDNYEIRVFDSPKEMQEAIKEKNKVQDNGISRMVATFDWKYSGGKEEPPAEQHYWEVSEGDWSMPWNYEKKTRDHYENKHRSVRYKGLSWAEKDYTIDEIGSTYTVQGFDLNYVGVEIGPSVKYRDGKIIHDPSASANSKAIQKRDSNKSYAEELLKNEFNVLMTRGVHGLYLHAVDPELQKVLKKASK